MTMMRKVVCLMAASLMSVSSALGQASLGNGVGPALQLPLNSNGGVVSSPMMVTIPSGASGATARSVSARLQDVISVLDFDPNANNPASVAGGDASTAINAAITYAHAITSNGGSSGAQVWMPFGTYSIKNPVLMLNGVTLVGECVPNGGSSSTIQCTKIVPGQAMATLVTQASFTNPTYSMGLQGLDVDSGSTYAISGSLVNLSVENSTFTNMQVQGASTVAGDCLHLASNTSGAATWINFITNSQFNGCVNGYGIYGYISDSRIANSDFANNKNDIYLLLNGNTLIGNEIANTYYGVSGGYGLVMQPNAATGCQFVNSVVGNYFNQNQSGDIHYELGSSGCSATTMAPTITGNSFVNSFGPAITVDNGIEGGAVVGNQFGPLNPSASSPNVVISFGGTTNAGWEFAGNTYNAAFTSRYLNLPSDAQVVGDGGTGLANNLLQTTTVRGGYLYDEFNAGTGPTYPSQNQGSAWGQNFLTGNSEVDFWNTNASPTFSFVWLQQTGAGSYANVMGLDPNGDLNMYGYVQPRTRTIASLPSCVAGLKGAVSYVSDTVGSAAPTFHGAVAGGGATTVNSLVSCDGSTWRYD